MSKIKLIYINENSKQEECEFEINATLEQIKQLIDNLNAKSHQITQPTQNDTSIDKSSNLSDKQKWPPSNTNNILYKNYKRHIFNKNEFENYYKEIEGLVVSKTNGLENLIQFANRIDMYGRITFNSDNILSINYEKINFKEKISNFVRIRGFASHSQQTNQKLWSNTLRCLGEYEIFYNKKHHILDFSNMNIEKIKDDKNKIIEKINNIPKDLINKLFNTRDEFDRFVQRLRGQANNLIKHIKSFDIGWEMTKDLILIKKIPKTNIYKEKDNPFEEWAHYFWRAILQLGFIAAKKNHDKQPSLSILRACDCTFFDKISYLNTEQIEICNEQMKLVIIKNIKINREKYLPHTKNELLLYIDKIRTQKDLFKTRYLGLNTQKNLIDFDAIWSKFEKIISSNIFNDYERIYNKCLVKTSQQNTN